MIREQTVRKHNLEIPQTAVVGHKWDVRIHSPGGDCGFWFVSMLELKSGGNEPVKR
jgi:hypothetical protein